MALIIPSVTEKDNPLGFPIATTFSPILALSEFPIAILAKLSPDIFNRATSIKGS